MSVFRTITLNCPECRQEVQFEASASVNADRRPDLRDAILDGSFQTQGCGRCQKEFRLDPQLNYVDLGRGQWLAVFPLNRLGDWVTLEAEQRDLFDRAYGSRAPASAREIGTGLVPRLVFGWGAFREKLVCQEHGLNDIELELVKMAVVTGLDDMPLSDQTELRLVDFRNGALVLAWIKAADEELISTLEVPLGFYQDIAADHTGWDPLRQDISNGLLVDMQRLLVAAE